MSLKLSLRDVFYMVAIAALIVAQWVQREDIAKALRVAESCDRQYDEFARSPIARELNRKVAADDR